MQVSKMIEATKFLPTNRFLMQERGPFKQAKEAIAAKIVNVKHTTNLSGEATMVPSMIALSKPKNAVRKNATPAWTQFLSLPRKLNMLNQPCGSGCDLPKTNAFAAASFPPIPLDDGGGQFAAVGSFVIEEVLA